MENFNTFNISYHCDTRLNQRGITKAMVAITLKYGKIRNDRYILQKNLAQKVLDENRKLLKSKSSLDNFETILEYKKLETENRCLLKIIDKGGIVVVEANNHCLTAYNYNSTKWI